MGHAHAAIKTCTNSALTYNIGCSHHVLMQASIYVYIHVCCLHVHLCALTVIVHIPVGVVLTMCLQRCVNRSV